MDQVDATNGCTPRKLFMNRQESYEKYTALLNKRMPHAASPVIARWIIELKVRFVVTRPRKTKLGDFRPPHKGKAAQITVNGDLNPYNFLVTTIHEFAHLGCYLEHGSKVNPHGKEWKKQYSSLLRPFLEKGIFPPDISDALNYHISKPSASSCSCPELSRALARHDDEDVVFLGDLRRGDLFEFQNVQYTHLERRRTRHVCERAQDGKRFLISGNARVEIPVQRLEK